MKYLSDYMESAQSRLWDENGAFFAFGNKQFEEKKKEGVKYASLGHGLICPTENAQKVINGLETIYQDAMRQDVEENGAEAIIRREYFNYESQISCSTVDALESLAGYRKQFPELFTDWLIAHTFKKCFRDAVENDWF